MRRTLLCAVLYLTCLLVSPFAAQQEPLSDLQRSSYAHEIQIMSLPQLRSWAREAGLSELGDLQTLQERLYSHYGLTQKTLEVSTDAAGGRSLRIEILQADRLQYGQTIRMSGSVEVVLTRTDETRVTRLQADRVIIDQSANRLSASGGARVDISEQDTETSYTADSFILDYEGLDGVLLDAVTRSDRTNGEGDLVEFYLTGDQVVLDDDVMILKESYFTSDVENSYYGLQASTMKILPDGDWFLTDAVLRIGRVPILYVPAFYYPADTLFFHPAFGFDTGRGAFINTTTYLFGANPEAEPVDESSFSTFMKMSSQEVTPYTVRDGALLMYVPEAQTDLQRWAQESGSYLSVQMDAYEQQGGFFGIDARIGKTAGIQELSIFAGVGFSADQTVQFMSESTLSVKTDHLDLSLSLPYYSDPCSKDAFTNRKELFDIDDLLSGQTYTPSADLSGFSWEFTGRASWTPGTGDDPLIAKISLERLDASLDWGDYDDETAAYLIEEIELPDAVVRISGTIFSFSGAEGAEDEQPAAARAHIYGVPIPEVLPAHEGPAAAELVLTGPLFASGVSGLYLDEDLPAADAEPAGTPVPWSTSLTYTLRDALQQTHQYDQVQLQYTDLDHALTGDLVWKSSLFDRRLQISEMLRPQYLYSSRVSRSESIDSYVDPSYQVLQDFSVSYAPLSLSYLFRSYLLSSEDRDEVIRHQLTYAPAWEAGQTSWKLSVLFTLPPLEQRTAPSLSVQYDRLTLTGSTEYLFGPEADSGFSKPLTLSLKADLAGASYAQVRWTHEIGSFEDSTLKLSVNMAVTDDLTAFGEVTSLVFDRSLSEAKSVLTYHKSSLTCWFDQVIDPGFQISSFRIRTGALSYTGSAWYDRIRYSAAVDASWYLNMIDPYDNSLDVSLNLGFSVAEFIDISFKTVSRNTATYAYFSRFSDDAPLGLLEDLLMSFNFFDRSDRVASNFNLDSLEIGIVHYMQDWDLHADITGKIGYDSEDDRWAWQPSVTIYLQWKALPEIDLEAARTLNGQSYEWDVK
jgi:hypothetical protein